MQSGTKRSDLVPLRQRKTEKTNCGTKTEPLNLPRSHSLRKDDAIVLVRSNGEKTALGASF